MDGMHDLGGKQGFGPVVRSDDNRKFKERWELKAAAISARLVGAKQYNMDEYRHAIERMDPRHYMAATYYERVLTAAATLCVEKGIFSPQALHEAAGGVFPLARPIGHGRLPALPVCAYRLGDTVRVKNEFVSGHTRMPAYIRGKCGVIVDISPAYAYPDAAGHGMVAEKEPTFDVRFDSRDLWPDSSEPAFVHVGVFSSYLEAAAPTQHAIAAPMRSEDR